MHGQDYFVQPHGALCPIRALGLIGALCPIRALGPMSALSPLRALGPIMALGQKLEPCAL